MDALTVGNVAPDFAFIDDGGRRRSLSDFYGAPVILALAPLSSRGAQPPIQRLTFHGESVPVLAPSDGEVARAYGVSGDVAMFVISRGTIVWRASPPDQVFFGFATSPKTFAANPPGSHQRRGY